ncbi:MAG: hypothetical protein ACT4PJ_16435 [Gemmatimonadaceae bacterium]
MNGEQVAAVIITAVIAIGVSISMVALAWASRRGDTVKPKRLDALEDRLARVEQALDTVAVEVERIGEAHRFTARLLTERLDPVPAETQRDREPNG